MGSVELVDTRLTDQSNHREPIQQLWTDLFEYMVVWGGVGGRGGGVGKIVKHGGMSNDRSSDKKSHKVRFEQALFTQIGSQLLYGLPVV